MRRRIAPPATRERTSFAVKAAPRPDAASRLAFHEKTMWRGRTVQPGDEVFVFAAEHHGGRGLVARGVAVAVSPGAGSRVHLEVERTGAPLRPLGRADLRAFRDRAEAGPGAELDHKLYRQATNKVAGLSAEAAAFLRGFF